MPLEPAVVADDLEGRAGPGLWQYHRGQPATATLLAEVMNEAGVPPGVYNVVHGFGGDSAGAFGPGRHPTSGAMFLYFEGPDGMTYEYSTGVSLISPENDASHQPRQFAAKNESFCARGAMPDIPEFKS